MKVTANQLRQIIKEEVQKVLREAKFGAKAGGKKVAHVELFNGEREVNVDGQSYLIPEIVSKKFPDLDSADWDAWSDAAVQVEKDLYAQHGVTHVVSSEDFGDERPHPLKDLYAHAGM